MIPNVSDRRSHGGGSRTWLISILYATMPDNTKEHVSNEEAARFGKKMKGYRLSKPA